MDNTKRKSITACKTKTKKKGEDKLDDAINKLLNFATEEQTTEENEYTMYGKSVGKQLNSLLPRHSAMAMGQIQKVKQIFKTNYYIILTFLSF